MSYEEEPTKFLVLVLETNESFEVTAKAVCSCCQKEAAVRQAATDAR